jgi:hypothetical protein
VGMDDTVRAASDAIDAYCAANPKPEWPPRATIPMPSGIVQIVIPPFGLRAKPVAVTYTCVDVDRAELRRRIRSVLDTSDECQEAIVELAAVSSASLDEVRDALETVIVDYAVSPRSAHA